ncbi:MAG: glucosamine-6-phosphate deaminase [Propionicimonas sp.]|uniref:glucosamine-6-phosphate deaminase n=1 Tax=Propionicimonas sp. TaxID=1955623 RepID=UPI002B20CDB1|nr:glucosamine-6-phosphate deaminase [Propionicimonas sp.]MEA4943765.1 glucosamine-6-phosphate deaminase [Propionicimonas sp.]MEA5117132.1 glucosamine-6-phosphate deaminase [Propionicimonas sp.]
MEVIICPDENRVAQVAAAKAAKLAAAIGPAVVFGVATGSSPVKTYNELAKLVAAGQLDVSQASAFALDEYVGIAAGHPQSYHEVINATVTVPLGLDPARVHVPDGFAADLEAAGPAYEAAIRAAGGVDIQFLGVGSNGHIGFNEPTSSLTSRTRIKTLAPRTREDNARFFASIDEVPRHCMTQGLGTIMDARNVVLMATGENKAAAIAAVVEGPVTAMWPGSVLQLHQHATIVVDEAAAAGLALHDYYQETYANLPDWQRLEV